MVRTDFCKAHCGTRDRLKRARIDERDQCEDCCSGPAGQ